MVSRNSYLCIIHSYLYLSIASLIFILASLFKLDFKPVGLTLIKVEDVESALTVLELGLGNRHVGKTNANLHSSRSHAVFTIYVSKTLE